MASRAGHLNVKKRQDMYASAPWGAVALTWLSQARLSYSPFVLAPFCTAVAIVDRLALVRLTSNLDAVCWPARIIRPSSSSRQFFRRLHTITSDSYLEYDVRIED